MAHTFLRQQCEHLCSWYSAESHRCVVVDAEPRICLAYSVVLCLSKLRKLVSFYTLLNLWQARIGRSFRATGLSAMESYACSHEIDAKNELVHCECMLQVSGMRLHVLHVHACSGKRFHVASSLMYSGVRFVHGPKHVHECFSFRKALLIRLQKNSTP